MGMTDAERQARYRARKTALGFTAVTLLVPKAAAPDLQAIAEALRGGTHLQPGPLRDIRSGKLVSVKAALASRGNLKSSQHA